MEIAPLIVPKEEPDSDWHNQDESTSDPCDHNLKIEMKLEEEEFYEENIVLQSPSQEIDQVIYCLIYPVVHE